MSSKIKRKALRPRDIANEISACINEGNLENILDFFHPEYTMSFPPTEPPKSGISVLRESFKTFIDSKATLISKVTGEIINNDIGLLQATWKILDSSGNIITEGKSVEVTKQNSDGTWVYLIDCPYGLPSI